MQLCEQLCFMNRRRRVEYLEEGHFKLPNSQEVSSADATAPVIWSRTIQKVREMSLLKGLFSVFSHSKEEIQSHVECLDPARPSFCALPLHARGVLELS